MQINLRKANAIQAEIRSAMNGIKLSGNVTVSEFDAKPEDVIGEAVHVFNRDHHRKMQLINALYDIRAKVARANVESGISDILAQVASYEAHIANDSDVSKMPVRKSAEEIQARIDKFKAAPASERSAIYGDRYNNVETGILDAMVIEGSKKLIKGFKRERQELNDKLLQLNVTTLITLKEDTVTTLKEEGIL